MRHVVYCRCRFIRHLQDRGVLFDVACPNDILTVSALDGQALRLILIAGDNLLLQRHHLVVGAGVDLETVVALVEGVGRRVGTSHNLHHLRLVVTAQEQRLDGTLQVTGRGVPGTSVGGVRTRALHVRHPHHVDTVAVGDGELRVLVLVHADVDIVLGGVTQRVGGDAVHILTALLVLVVGVVHILITAQRQEGELEVVLIVGRELWIDAMRLILTGSGILLIVSFLILVYLSPSGIGEQVDARDKPVGTLHIAVDTRLRRRQDEIRTVHSLVIVADDDIVVAA